jgi:hypothetical protein
MARRPIPLESRPALEPVPPEAILVDKLERLMHDISLVVGELKATLPKPTNRPRPNAKRLIEGFGEINTKGR